MSTEPLPTEGADGAADTTPAMPELAAAPAEAVEAEAAGAEAPVAQPAAAKAPEMSLGACTRELRQRFPALFGDSPKPIKLRIQADIQARAPGVFSKKILSIFLHRHTTHTSYLVALSKAQARFDLDGQPAGELAEEHRLAAVEELKRRRAIIEERRAAEDDERRQRFGLVRDFERTTLTRANFCALKGIAEDQLDTLLATIRQEIAEWEARRPAAGARRDERGGREQRGPRPGNGRPQGRGPAGGGERRPRDAAPRGGRKPD